MRSAASKEKRRAYDRAYYAANREKRRAYLNAWAAANKEYEKLRRNGISREEARAVCGKEQKP